MTSNGGLRSRRARYREQCFVRSAAKLCREWRGDALKFSRAFDADTSRGKTETPIRQK